MTVNPAYQRAMILQAQNRHADAERELRQVLAEDPRDAEAHAMLALCLAEQMRLRDATAEAQQAVGLAPDQPMTHYALARVWMARQRPADAADAIGEAIRLDPHDADYWSILAAVRLEQRAWPGALHAAEKGLEVDAEHAGCQNLRAMALVKLGRRDEAGQTIHDALRRDPENAFTHANEGWRLLNASQPKQAMHHFREALRLDPSLEFAQAGIVEALKAHNFLYRWLLAYFLFMARLGSRAQWGILIGGYVGYRLLSGAAERNPDIAPWVRPIIWLYIAFAILTWLADPVFNLLLRLHPVGKYALSSIQRIAATVVGGVMVLAVACGGYALYSGSEAALAGTVMIALLLLPVSAIFKCEWGWPRLVMSIGTGVLILILLAATFVLHLSERVLPDNETAARAGIGLFNLFIYATLAAQLAANYLIAVRPKK